VIRASDVLGAVIVAESGEELGRVRDIKLARVDSSTEGTGVWRVDALTLGQSGLLERFGAVTTRGGEPAHAPESIAWSRVLRIDDGRVVVTR
jgi:sporulation protein YlmC with PRC-barrel domain